MSTDRVVHLDIAAGVAAITLDSQHNRNALSTRLLTELNSALTDVAAAVEDGTVQALVLGHAGPAFCAGADLKERAALPAGTTVDSQPMVAAMNTLIDLPVPTIAAVNGAVRAGGIGLMAACDLVVVAPDVTFALTEVRIGVVAAIISVPIFRRCTPSAIAGPLLTGESFDAEAARAMGLVTHVGEVETVLAELVGGIKLGAPTAVRATKALLAAAYDTSGDDRSARFEEMRQLSEHFFAGADAAEGMAAFAERRPPAWQHPG